MPVGHGEKAQFDQDCKTVVFGRFRKAGSAVSVILECEAREPHTPVFSLAPAFRSNMIRRSRSQKIRPFCSLVMGRSVPSTVLLKVRVLASGEIEQGTQKLFLVTLQSKNSKTCQ